METRIPAAVRFDHPRRRTQFAELRRSSSEERAYRDPGSPRSRSLTFVQSGLHVARGLRVEWRAAGANVPLAPLVE